MYMVISKPKRKSTAVGVSQVMVRLLRRDQKLLPRGQPAQRNCCSDATVSAPAPSAVMVRLMNKGS